MATASSSAESNPDILFEAVVKGLADSNQNGDLRGIGSLNVGIGPTGVVTAVMSMNGPDGLPIGKTFFYQTAPLSKPVSGPPLELATMLKDNRFLLARSVACYLEGATIHPPPHHDVDAFATIVFDGHSYAVSVWYEHDAKATKERKRMEKREVLEKLMEQKELERKQKQATKAERRERERLEHAEQLAVDERRRQEKQATADATAEADAVRRQKDLEARIAALELKDKERKAEEAEKTRQKVIDAKARQAQNEATREAERVAKFGDKKGSPPQSRSLSTSPPLHSSGQ